MKPTACCQSAVRYYAEVRGTSMRIFPIFLRQAIDIHLPGMETRAKDKYSYFLDFLTQPAQESTLLPFAARFRPFSAH